MIEVSGVAKEFRLQLRSEGRFAQIKDFFAPRYQAKVAVT